MENLAHNQEEKEESSLTPVRESAADIVAGARQTDQLEKMQANARQESGEQSTFVPPLAVNNGEENKDTSSGDNFD